MSWTAVSLEHYFLHVQQIQKLNFDEAVLSLAIFSHALFFIFGSSGRVAHDLLAKTWMTENLHAVPSLLCCQATVGGASSATLSTRPSAAGPSGPSTRPSTAGRDGRGGRRRPAADPPQTTPPGRPRVRSHTALQSYRDQDLVRTGERGDPEQPGEPSEPLFHPAVQCSVDATVHCADSGRTFTSCLLDLQPLAPTTMLSCVHDDC